MKNHQPIKGAIAIITAGVLFACINTLIPKLTSISPIDSSVIALVQYLIAFVFLVPSMNNVGFFFAENRPFWTTLFSHFSFSYWYSMLDNGIG